MWLGHGKEQGNHSHPIHPYSTAELCHFHAAGGAFSSLFSLFGVGMWAQRANSCSLAALARIIPIPPDAPPCWKLCSLWEAASFSLLLNVYTPAWPAAHLLPVPSQGSGCPGNIPWAPVNLSLLYGKSARNHSLQLPTHTTPCSFTDTYPLTKITIKKPPREMYFWEPVLLTRCHCETYIINKSYASFVFFFFFTIICSVRSNIIYEGRYLVKQTLIVKLRIAGWCPFPQQLSVCTLATSFITVSHCFWNSIISRKRDGRFNTAVVCLVGLFSFLSFFLLRHKTDS